MLTADPRHWLLAAAALTGWGLVLARAVWRGRARAPSSDVLVAYASQSGQAEVLAQRAAQALGTVALPLRVVDAQALATARQALFVLSTAGAGEAPDNARAFVQRLMPAAPALDHLSYGLLALGDRGYARFCGFGRAMDDWLTGRGAQPLFPRIEADRLAPAALAVWKQTLTRHFRVESAPTPAVAAPGDWTLAQREILNPGSPGAPLCRVVLHPQGLLPRWQAGDTAEVEIPAPDGPLQRSYTLASLPGDGHVELILRLAEDGRGGRARGPDWIGRQLPLGGVLRLTLRSNPAFHPPEASRPLILLGAGSGIAGLMAQLAHRAEQPGAGPVWMMFGERSAPHDHILQDRLSGWQAQGTLARLDRAFSRDGSRPAYVQDLLTAAAGDLRDWLRDGAVLYLCGRRDGLAVDVEAALDAALGAGAAQRLADEGRFLRDVY